MSNEIMQIPSVLLTERAFEDAKRRDIVDIQPNRDSMLAIGQITKTDDRYLPDITIMRADIQPNWDTRYAKAPDAYRYFPATELAVQERELVYVSAGGLRQHALDTGKKIMELTVRDWDALGMILADTIEDNKTIGSSHPRKFSDLAISAVSWAAGFDSPQQQRMKQAATLQPYIITRRQRTS